MPVQINEVIVRAIITGNDDSKGIEPAPTDKKENLSAVTKNELLELIDEVINDKKER